jgi:uncharacterized membrane protein YkoI
MKRLVIGASVLALTVGSMAVASVSATKYSGHELAKDATITLAQARRAALKASPGRITDQELEKEAGGSGLRYSFDIRSNGKNVEVGIDAMSGKVLENDVESAAKEKQEKAMAAKPKQ